MSKPDSCLNCKAFLQNANNKSLGLCRRLPPVPLVFRYVPQAQVGQNGEVNQILNGLIDGYYPITNTSSYCCEHILADHTDEVEEPIPGEEPISGLDAPAQVTQ